MHVGAAPADDEVELGTGLNALGDGGDVQLIGQADDGADDDGVTRLGFDVLCEGLRDLDVVSRKAAQIFER